MTLLKTTGAVICMAAALHAQAVRPGGGGGGGAPSGPAVNAQTSTAYTLQASDIGKVITTTNSSPVTITIPLSLPTGFYCLINQAGTGQVSIVGAASVTVNLLGGAFQTPGQNAIAAVYWLAANTYTLGGSLM